MARGVLVAVVALALAVPAAANAPARSPLLYAGLVFNATYANSGTLSDPCGSPFVEQTTPVQIEETTTVPAWFFYNGSGKRLGRLRATATGTWNGSIAWGAACRTTVEDPTCAPQRITWDGAATSTGFLGVQVQGRNVVFDFSTATPGEDVEASQSCNGPGFVGLAQALGPYADGGTTVAMATFRAWAARPKAAPLVRTIRPDAAPEGPAVLAGTRSCVALYSIAATCTETLTITKSRIVISKTPLRAGWDR
jgi:hypothetical protein